MLSKHSHMWDGKLDRIEATGQYIKLNFMRLIFIKLHTGLAIKKES